MATTIALGPTTRVEGHLEVSATLGTVGGKQQVVSAQSAGTMFRGFEIILQGRDPRDAVQYTQRVCGVCPISHGMAAALNLEAAFGVTAPDNGRVVRNLVLGANFIQSHILHFYHLAAPDYINTTGILDMAPWTPRFVTSDMVGGSTAQALVGHYVQALAMRRKAHQMGAILGGRLPATPVFVAGGATEPPTAQNITDFRTLLTELRAFINDVMIPDVLAVAAAFPTYYKIGKGCGNLLAYGVFDLNAAGSSKLLKRGRYTKSAYSTVNPTQINEYVKYSWYKAANGFANPAWGSTTPQATKSGAYSWIKAPRYAGLPHETGPLARMWVNGDYRKGISVLDRLAARCLEAKKVADAMDGWLNQLTPGAAVYSAKAVPATGTGIGLTEAPRGALGHWMQITGGKISRYQIVTPTAWNASPKDDSNVMGPIEQALVGTPVKDAAQPIELLRVIHSFDPCLSCAVHMVRPGKDGQEVVIGVDSGAV
jgi:hydrogenase large subunit